MNIGINYQTSFSNPSFSGKYPKLKKSEVIALLESGKSRREIIKEYNASNMWFQHNLAKYNLPAPRDYKSQSRLNKILELWNNNTPLRKILEETNMSKEQFAVFIKQHLKISPIDFKRQRIVNLFNNTKMTIAEICKKLDESPFVVKTAIKQSRKKI